MPPKKEKADVFVTIWDELFDYTNESALYAKRVTLLREFLLNPSTEDHVKLMIAVAFSALNDRLQGVMQRRYGFGGFDEPQTLAEIGKATPKAGKPSAYSNSHEITPERVRRLLANAQLQLKRELILLIKKQELLENPVEIQKAVSLIEGTKRNKAELNELYIFFGKLFVLSGFARPGMFKEMMYEKEEKETIRQIWEDLDSFNGEKRSILEELVAWEQKQLKKDVIVAKRVSDLVWSLKEEVMRVSKG